jgi:hypothetical protein
VKKKLHGKADARGLSGAEIAGRELQAREAREAAATQDKDEDQGVLVGDDEDILVPSTPPRAIRESQGGTTIILAIRTPEALRRAPPPAEALPLPPPVWRLLPEEPSAPPASTAPPRLAGEEGRGKRKRVYTLKKAMSVQQGDMDESQTSKLQKP